MWEKNAEECKYYDSRGDLDSEWDIHDKLIETKKL